MKENPVFTVIALFIICATIEQVVIHIFRK